MSVVMQSAIPGLTLLSQDGVHDVYALPQQKQLVVYTDRMTVSGQLLGAAIPYRGLMFSQITLYWLTRFKHLVGHNLVTRSIERFPREAIPYAAMLKGRSAISQKLKELPLAFRVIGNLTGAEWRSYQETRTVAGKSLSRGLRESDWLEKPIMIIVPTSSDISKQDMGDISKWTQRMYGPVLYKKIEDICLSIFSVARGYAARRGLVIADTFFEFGLHEGTPYIINDVMTPERSTYWSAAAFAAGPPQMRWDRQPLLEWLAAQGWKKNQPLPEIPPDIISAISSRCRAIYDVMAGKVALTEETEEKEEKVAV